MKLLLPPKKHRSFLPVALGVSLFSVFAALAGCTGSNRDTVQSKGSESKLNTNAIPQYFGEESDDISEVFSQVHSRFALDRDDEGNVILIVRKDLDPAVINEMVAGLAKWSEARGERSATAAISIKDFPVVNYPMAGADTVAYNVSGVVPGIVKALHLQYPADGPNCWNLTLLTANLSKFFAHTQEFQFFEAMNQPQVAKVTALKDVRVGDIVAVRQRDASPEGFSEIHAATYVTKNLLWTKNGARESKPFRLMDSEEVFGIYMNSQPLSSVPKMMPWKCTLPNSVADSSCEVYVEYLRAVPLLDQIPAELQADVQTISVFSHLRDFYGDATPFVSQAEVNDLEEKFPRPNVQGEAQSALAKKTLAQVDALLNNSGSEAPKGLPLAALQLLRSLLQTM